MSGSYDGPETKGWWRPICCIPLKMTDKLAIVTGASSGIGLAVAGELARRGAEVIMACRDLKKAQTAKDSLLEKYGPENPNSTSVDVVDQQVQECLQPISEKQLILEHLDLSSFDSIRAFVERMKKAGRPIHYLVNNAGLISPIYEQSADGHELVFAVNYLGAVLLTESLLPLLQKARIVNMSSMLQFTGNLYKPTLHLVGADYGPYASYGQSKLALTMYSVELAKRLEDTNVIVVCINPGQVATALGRHSNSWMDKVFNAFMKPQEIQPWEAAQQVIHALLRRKITNGGYYDNYERVLPDRLAMTQSERTWLWEKTKEMIKFE